MELKHQGVGVTIIEPGRCKIAIFDKAAASGAVDGYAGSETTQRLYAQAVEAATGAMANQKPAPVDGVVKTVVKALSADRPPSLRGWPRCRPTGHVAPPSVRPP
jgi:hypothetical protein